MKFSVSNPLFYKSYSFYLQYQLHYLDYHINGQKYVIRYHIINSIFKLQFISIEI